jgi:hypothetical protein
MAKNDKVVSGQISLFGKKYGARFVYDQTQGAKGLCWVYVVGDGQKELGHITLHPDGKLNKHGICEKLSDSEAKQLALQEIS